MNRTKKTIGWCDFSWNPVTGCSRRCDYCYAWRMANRLRGRFGYPKDDPFRVTFHPNRLREPSKVKKPSKIFVCSMGELFDRESKYGWIGLVFAEIRRNPQHTFQILTKRPEVLPQFDFPENTWVGITVDRKEALDGLFYLTQTNAKIRFVSFEPLLEPIDPWLEGVQWVIIGAKTGSKPFIPPAEWVQTIINNARHFGCAVFLKHNLRWPERVEEFP